MLRRARGLVLRFVRRRRLAIAVGLVLAGPAAWIEINGGGEAWWISGAALVCGATGVALVWIGLTGVSPDYYDPGQG